VHTRQCHPNVQADGERGRRAAVLAAEAAAVGFGHRIGQLSCIDWIAVIAMV
jgi:hypothetical protein